MNDLYCVSGSSPTIPASRPEYLDRKARLWSLIQSIDPESAHPDQIVKEFAALKEYDAAQKLCWSVQSPAIAAGIAPIPQHSEAA